MALAAPRLLLPAAAAAAGVAEPPPAAVCGTAMDCQLNGECAAGRCVCDAGWRGARCGELALGAAAAVWPPPGQPMVSWGADVAADDTGAWHLFVRTGGAAEYHENNCTHHGRTLLRAEGGSPFGPFAEKQLLRGCVRTERGAACNVTEWCGGSNRLFRCAAGDGCGGGDGAGWLLLCDGGAVHALTLRGPWRAESPPRELLGANPTLLRLRNGTVLQAYRYNGSVPRSEGGGWNATRERVGVAAAPHLRAAFTDVAHDALPGIAAEDPFLFESARGVHMLFHWFNCSALYTAVGGHAWSADGGASWRFDPSTAAYDIRQLRFPVPPAAGAPTRFERPSLLFRGDGRPLALAAAVEFNHRWWDPPPRCATHAPARVACRADSAALTALARVL